MYRDRIRLPSLSSKVMSAADAAALIQDGMTVGMSGFTRAGEAKAVPHALAERAKLQPLKITLMTGASLGNDLDKQLTELPISGCCHAACRSRSTAPCARRSTPAR